MNDAPSAEIPDILQLPCFARQLALLNFYVRTVTAVPYVCSGWLFYCQQLRMPDRAASQGDKGRRDPLFRRKDIKGGSIDDFAPADKPISMRRGEILPSEL